MIASLENVSLVIDKKSVLHDINLQIKKNKITTLIGPNGGGKTSIARVLVGIVNPTSGKVVINPKIKIGYMAQKINIDKTIPITAKEFISLGLKKVKLSSEVKDLIEVLDVSKILNSQIHDLSGGQLQKILFLRAIANNPDLLVLDEPMQCMDVNAIENFYKILNDIRNKNGCTILLISHDLHFVMQKTDIVFCINHHVCCHGSPQHVNQHPDYLSLFSKKSEVAIYEHHHNHNHPH